MKNPSSLVELSFALIQNQSHCVIKAIDLFVGKQETDPRRVTESMLQRLKELHLVAPERAKDFLVTVHLIEKATGFCIHCTWQDQAYLLLSVKELEQDALSHLLREKFMVRSPEVIVMVDTPQGFSEVRVDEATGVAAVQPAPPPEKILGLGVEAQLVARLPETYATTQSLIKEPGKVVTADNASVRDLENLRDVLGLKSPGEALAALKQLAKSADQAVVPQAGTPLTGVPEAMKVLIKALHDDSNYAWSWHANIAMCMRDEGVDVMTAQRGASRFLQILTMCPDRAGIDTRTFAEYKALERQVEELARAPKDSSA